MTPQEARKYARLRDEARDAHIALNAAERACHAAREQVDTCTARLTAATKARDDFARSVGDAANSGASK